MFKFIFRIVTISVILLWGIINCCASSLWQKSAHKRSSIYADRVAQQRGDILSVLVSETHSMSNSVRTTTDKGVTIDNTVTSFLFPAANSGFGSNNGALPQTDIEGSNDYTGGGSISNTQTLTGKVSVLVIDVLPNGNLVIEGVRVITYSGETFYAVLRGFVRKDDVTYANTVDSDKIADARIQYISEGSLTEVQKKGWLTKINELLNPF